MKYLRMILITYDKLAVLIIVFIQELYLSLPHETCLCSNDFMVFEIDWYLKC